jgi:hypothetical protein
VGRPCPVVKGYALRRVMLKLYTEGSWNRGSQIPTFRMNE